MKKRILSICLIICMLLTIASIGVSATKATVTQATRTYTDVSEGAWYYSAVQYVTENGLMNGIGGNAFGPAVTTSRAMIVTILHRLEGEPVASASSFTDVPAGAWYADAVAWASANNIVNGYGNGTFDPENGITREQIAAILYRYASYKGYDVTSSGSLTSFTDGAATSAWAQSAMQWAVGSGLIIGNGSGILDPVGTATRAEVATILMNFCTKNNDAVAEASKIGWIAYSDGTASAEYNSSKTPIGIVMATDPNGNPKKIISLNEAKKEKWYYTTGGFACMNNLGTSTSNGSSNWAVIKGLDTERTEGQYPAFEYAETVHTGDKTWYIPARDELKEIYNNIDKINAGLSKIPSAKEIPTNAAYWSSSQTSNSTWTFHIVSFFNGYEGADYPSNEHYVVLIANAIPDTVYIPAGTFAMGDDDTTSMYQPTPYEQSVHNVTITTPFYMSTHTVTQAEWKAVMGGENNPSYFDGSVGREPAAGEEQDLRPVENVNWCRAIAYCNKKSIADGLTPCYSVEGIDDWAALEYDNIPYNSDKNAITTEPGIEAWENAVCDWDANGWRLPTEAEWEYCARAGDNTTDGPVWSGTNDVTELSSYAWTNDSIYGNSFNITHEVMRKKPNAWGLYDMSGNVWELCWDFIAEPYSADDVTDPHGPTRDYALSTYTWSQRTGNVYPISRGGAFGYDASAARAQYRCTSDTYQSSSHTGFRICRNAD